MGYFWSNLPELHRNCCLTAGGAVIIGKKGLTLGLQGRAMELNGKGRSVAAPNS
jgi:hypothetical protein